MSGRKSVIFIVALLILGAGIYFFYQNGEEPVFCTLDAKICPDGSYVGRVPPTCEFAACPAWEPFEKLKYIFPVDWPPQSEVIDEPFSCLAAGEETARAGRTEPRTIAGRQFCVTRVTEGAAGSIYTMYAYAFPREGGTEILTFSVRFSQCGNYGEPQKTECETERATFDVDRLVDNFVQSVF